MTIENYVSIDFLSTFVDSINVFDCRLPYVIKCTAFVSVRAIILAYAYGTSKVLAIKKPSFIGFFIICVHYPVYALSESHTSGKGCV